jgi:putative serine protease PepD
VALGPGHLRWVLEPLAVAALATPLTGSGSNGTTAFTTAGVPAAMAALANRPASLQQEFVALVRRVSPSVVQIRTAQALGSGVVFDGRGDVVTNAHVVAGQVASS